MSILNFIFTKIFRTSFTTVGLKVELAKLEAALRAREAERAALAKEAALRESLSKLRSELGITA